MISCMLPVVVLVVAIYGSYALAGMYGIACAAFGIEYARHAHFFKRPLRRNGYTCLVIGFFGNLFTAIGIG